MEAELRAVLSLFSATQGSFPFHHHNNPLSSSHHHLASNFFRHFQPTEALSTASPSKTPPESSNQAQELKETLKGGIKFLDSFMDQMRTALSHKSEPSDPPAQVNDTQANLHDREKLIAAEASVFPASSCGSQFHQTDPSDTSQSPPESGDQAEELAEALDNLALLGLRLEKDDSFMNQVSTSQSQKSKPFRSPAEVIDLQAYRCSGGRFKAEHVPATLIQIGSWQFASVHIADLVAKFYFTKRKLIWEVLVNGLKNKMEIRWADISAIRATIEENKSGILEIELDQPPTFYKETDPQPRRPTLWELAHDFTGGQALTYRRHYLVFPPAALDKNYIKLLISDCRLLELSQSSFPSSTERTFSTLLHYGLENLQMTQVSNNFSRSEALLPLRPAAAAYSALYLREQSNSPDVGEAGAPTFQIPAIMRKTRGESVLDSDPISCYQPRPPPAINSTFTPPIGSLSTAHSANNRDANGVQEKHNGYADSSRKSVGPSEQNWTFTSPVRSLNARASSSIGDEMDEAGT